MVSNVTPSCCLCCVEYIFHKSRNAIHTCNSYKIRSISFTQRENTLSFTKMHLETNNSTVRDNLLASWIDRRTGQPRILEPSLLDISGFISVSITTVWKQRGISFRNGRLLQLLQSQTELVVKWTLLPCLDAESHPCLHNEVLQISFSVRERLHD